MKIPSLFSKTSFLFLVIFLFSLFFRTSYSNLIEFKGDEAINLYLAALPFFGKGFAAGSTISSFGLLNPPLINYLLLPPVIFSQDPRVVSFYIGVINSLAISSLFLISLKIFSKISSFLAMTLLAFAPWSIIYSRKIWAQDLLLPLCIPIIYSSVKIISENNKKYWFLYIFFSLLTIQIHQPSLFFITILTLLILIKRPGISFVYIFWGFVIGLLPLIPYLLYQIQTQCISCDALFNATQNTSDKFDFVHFLRPLQILNNGHFSFLLGQDSKLFYERFAFIPTINMLFFLEYGMLIIGSYYFWKKYKKIRYLLYAAILLPVMYVSLKIVPHIHYYAIIIPLLFLFFASFFDNMLDKKNPILLKISGFVLFGTLLLASVLYIVSFFQFVKTQGFLRGDYGSTFMENNRTAREFFGDFTNDPDFDEIFLAHHISIDFLYANSSGKNILYDTATTQENLPYLIRQLEHNPTDRRVVNELIHFYTSNIFDKSIVKELEKNNSKGKGYEIIYREVDKYYREIRK